MLEMLPVRDGMKKIADEHLALRRLEWAKFKGVRNTMEPPSSAFVDSVEVSYLGPTSLDIVEMTSESVFSFSWNPPSRRIVDKIAALYRDQKVDFAGRARSGAPYAAGPYANKQLKNWARPRWRETIFKHAFAIYRSELWQEEIKPLLLQAFEQESNNALDALAAIQGDAETYLLAGKSGETGVGYNRLWRNRLALARAIDRGEAQHVLEHDIELFRDGQQTIWEHWPFKGTIISGYLGYTGSSAVSRSDVDVTNVHDDGAKVTWTVEASVRAANITPISWSSTKALSPRRKMMDTLSRHCPLGYYKPMTKDVFNVFLHPPVTASFADQCDRLIIDADWGFQWPAPSVEQHGRTWSYVQPREEEKSGADGFIGQGCGNRGVTRWITPEYSSGRPYTRVGYQFFADTLVSRVLAQAGIRFNAASNGDDQAIDVAYDDVPAVYDTVLPPYLRTKGSDGNVVFRWGKECVFTSPDHVAIFNIPRPIKTMTSANLALKTGRTVDMNIDMGATKLLQVSEESARAASRTWEVSPDVFYMEGEPKDLVRAMQSSQFQSSLKDAILRGAIDEHVATFLGEIDQEEFE